MDKVKFTPFICLKDDYFSKTYGVPAQNPLEEKHLFSYSICSVDDYDFPVYRKEVPNFNILEIVAGTNGYHDGDSGHGCRTFVRLRNLGCTDIKVNKLVDSCGDDEGVEILLGGDAELSTLIEALEFAADVLKSQCKAFFQ